MGNALLIMNSFDTETTTARAAQTAVPHLVDTNEHGLRASASATPSWPQQINTTSLLIRPTVQTIRREIDRASESVSFILTAVLCSDVSNVFVTWDCHDCDDCDDCGDCDNEDCNQEDEGPELIEGLQVDLPGCDDIELKQSPVDKWTITMPIWISFSMPKVVADLLSDKDIMERVEAELKRQPAGLRCFHVDF